MGSRISLSEVVSSLSVALDLTDGQPLGHTMRTCLIGMRMARELGFSTDDASSLYYALLLKDAGCSSNAARLCQLFGTDDLVLKPMMRDVDRQSSFHLALNTARAAARGAGLRAKLRHFTAIAKSEQVMSEIMTLRCDRGGDIARRLGFSQATAEAVRHLDEHWNGKGHPDGLAGAAIPLMSRIMSLSQVLDAFHHKHGARKALRVARKRSGTWFDPSLAQLVQPWGREQFWWDRLHTADLASDVMAEEPQASVRWISEDDVDVIARAFADIIDAKSPYTFSHSRNVAAYALGIARELGLDSSSQRRAYRAGLLHDIGKLGVSNSILDKPAKLTPAERAAVQRHPFYTWEILSRVPAFRDFAWSASLHHERLDGSGYPWRLHGARLDLTARIICVADVYEALTADRPYRKSLSWDEARRILWQGRGTTFDPSVLDALVSCYASHGGNMSSLAPFAAA